MGTEESPDPKSCASHRAHTWIRAVIHVQLSLSPGEGGQEISLCSCCGQDQVHHSLVPVKWQLGQLTGELPLSPSTELLVPGRGTFG